jgi:hypothetical protein
MSGSKMTVSLEQMKGAIGSLLFFWSRIELELNESLKELNNVGLQKPAHGISRKLDLWSDEVKRHSRPNTLQAELSNRVHMYLKAALKDRNLVSHGIRGITAQVREEDQEAHLALQLGEVTRTLTWTELQSQFEILELGRSAIRDLTTAALDHELLRVNEVLQRWKDFPNRQ